MIVKKGVKKTKETNEVDILKKENEELKNKISEIEKMLVKMMENNSQVVNNDIIQDDEYVDIPPNKYIKVMSLTNHQLVLTTELQGKGTQYIFNKFGEIVNIMYSDLSKIVNTHQRFTREGKFYIMDKTVVRNYGLEKVYENILDKKTLENILEFDKDDIVSIFSTASKSQQETIVSLIINKIRAGEPVDYNKIERLSRAYGKNIIELSRPKNLNEDE